MLGENIADWAKAQVAEAEARGKAEGIIDLLRRQVAQHVLSVDQARAEVVELVAAGLLSEEAGRRALEQLG